MTNDPKILFVMVSTFTVQAMKEALSEMERYHNKQPENIFLDLCLFARYIQKYRKKG